MGETIQTNIDAEYIPWRAVEPNLQALALDAMDGELLCQRLMQSRIAQVAAVDHQPRTVNLFQNRRPNPDAAVVNCQADTVDRQEL